MDKDLALQCTFRFFSTFKVNPTKLKGNDDPKNTRNFD